MSENLWLVGRFISIHDDGTCWEWIGIFDTEWRAVDACQDETYFIGPAKLNESLPYETVDWPGCYYPKSNYLPEAETPEELLKAEAEAPEAPNE